MFPGTTATGRRLIATLAFFVLLCSSAHATPVISTNFTGITLNTTFALGTGAAPPDTIGAVGPSHIVELVNGAYAVYSKTGTTVSLTDPRVAYDQASGRWFAAQITTANTHNDVLVARSNSSDPTAGWRAVQFQGDTGFADFPTLSLAGGADPASARVGSAFGEDAAGGPRGGSRELRVSGVAAEEVPVGAVSRPDVSAAMAGAEEHEATASPHPGADGRAAQDVQVLIARLNPVLRGWGNYFRTGNAALKLNQVDDYVRQWLGLHRLFGTVRYPGVVHA